jgi:hypothetical protein
MMMQRLKYILVFFLLFSPKNAFAYIDPGSGSYFFQLALASLFGLLFALKIHWRKIVSFLVRLLPKSLKNKATDGR